MALPKNKTIINIDDYTGFRWNGKHTSQLGLTIVSSSSRYSLNPISSIINNTVDVPGGDGQYFFNSTYGPKKWTINFAFDNLDDYQWRDLLNWLYHKDTSDLVFDELPYKAYNAKLEGTPTVNYLCFTEAREKQKETGIDKDTLEPYDWGSYDPASYITHAEDGTDNFDTMYYKKRIYRGEGTLNFVAFFPYAYSARNYNNQYMKYLDEVEYFPNISQTEQQQEQIGVVKTIVKDGKWMMQLNSIEGTSLVDTESGTITQGLLGENDEDNFTLYHTIDGKQKEWVTFNLTDSDSGNENEFITFGNLGSIKDTIEYKENNETYELVKRVNQIDLLSNDYFIEGFEFNFDNSAGHFVDHTITFNLEKLLGDRYSSLKLPDNEEELLLVSNYFSFSAPPVENTTNNSPLFYIKSLVKKKDKAPKITLEFWDGDDDNFNLFTKIKGLIDDRKDNTKSTPSERDLLTTDADKALWLFFPQQEQSYDLTQSINTNEKLTKYFDDSIVLGLKNQNLEYNVNFEFSPALYDNFEEWKDSSGLKESKYISETEEYYDYCTNKNTLEADYGFKVYNGGDLPTPFRINLPVENKQVTDSKNEITFALVQVDNDTEVKLNDYKIIYSVTDLKNGIPYGIKGDNVEYKYYFYKITDYIGNKADFLNIETGEFENYGLTNGNIVCRVQPQESEKVLNSFSVRYYNDDSLNSYAEIIKNYTAAAAKQEPNPSFTSRLEIDTYKQTINFIVTSFMDGKETIIPCYFMITRGELFKIPPKIDNLYLLVYNQRENKNSFITKNYKKVPEIDYRYLYL